MKHRLYIDIQQLNCTLNHIISFLLGIGPVQTADFPGSGPNSVAFQQCQFRIMRTKITKVARWLSRPFTHRDTGSSPANRTPPEQSNLVSCPKEFREASVGFEFVTSTLRVKRTATVLFQFLQNKQIKTRLLPYFSQFIISHFIFEQKNSNYTAKNGKSDI